MWELRAVTLLALCKFYRAQTFANIKIQNIYVTSNNTGIRIEDRIKTSGPERYRLLLVLPYFKDKPSLCVDSILVKYLGSTEMLRDTSQALFIAIKKIVCTSRDTNG